MRTRSVALTIVAVSVGVFFVLSVGAASGTARATSKRVTPRIMTCASKTVYEPKNYVIACADANSLLVNIHWTSWTPTSASALATYSANDCTPNCAAGKFHSYSARASFSGTKRTKYGPLYSRLKVSYAIGSKVHSFSTTLPLRPLA